MEGDSDMGPLTRGEGGELTMPDTEVAWRQLAHRLLNRDELNEIYLQQERIRREQEELDSYSQIPHGHTTSDCVMVQIKIVKMILLTLVLYAIFSVAISTEYLCQFEEIISAILTVLSYLGLFFTSLLTIFTILILHD